MGSKVATRGERKPGISFPSEVLLDIETKERVNLCGNFCKFNTLDENNKSYCVLFGEYQQLLNASRSNYHCIRLKRCISAEIAAKHKTKVIYPKNTTDCDKISQRILYQLKPLIDAKVYQFLNNMLYRRISALRNRGIK